MEFHQFYFLFAWYLSAANVYGIKSESADFNLVAGYKMLKPSKTILSSFFK